LCLPWGQWSPSLEGGYPQIASCGQAGEGKVVSRDQVGERKSRVQRPGRGTHAAHDHEPFDWHSWSVDHKDDDKEFEEVWPHGLDTQVSFFRFFLCLIFLFFGQVRASPESDMIVAIAYADLLYWLKVVAVGLFLLACYWSYVINSLIPWLKKKLVHWQTMGYAFGVASILVPVALKFLPKLFGSKRDLYPQGARQDGNRAGMFLTGLLSLCMFGLAPFMGAKKIVNLIKPILDMLRQIPYLTWFCDWIHRWWKGEVTFDDLPQTNREFDEHLASADLADLQDDLEKLHDKFKGCKYCKVNPCECPEEEICKTCHRKYCVCDPDSSVLIDENLNPKTTDSSGSSEESYCPLGCLHSLDDDTCGKNAQATRKLNEMLEQVEEDVDRTTEGLRASGEKCPRGNNIGFDYTKRVKFVAAQKKAEKGKKVPLEVSHCRLCRKLIENCMCCRTHKATVESDDDEILKPEGLFDTTKFWNIFYTRKDDVCGKAGEAKQNDADMKAHFEKRESEIPPYDEKSEEWWNNFWESGPTWDGIWEKCSPTLKKCGEFLYDNKHIIAGVAAGLAFRYAMRKDDDEEYEATPQHRKGKSKQGRARGTRVAKGGKHYERPSGGAEQEMDAYDPYLVYIGGSDEDHDDEYEHEFEDPYYDDSYYQFKGYNVKPQDMTPEQKKEAIAKLTLKEKEEAYLRGKKFAEETVARLKQELLIAQKQSVKMPSVRDDAAIKRKIYESKKRTFRVKKDRFDAFILDAREALEAEMLRARKQSWNPNQKATGIYKIYDDQDHYRCTGTLVGKRMFVVNHAINESLVGDYHARNHINSLKLKLEDFTPISDEIGWFLVEGIPSPFKNSDLKILEVASVINVFGFGGGEGTTPDCVSGFASPLGWCSAETRFGDCSAPALNADGKIVGFWTHGNGKKNGLSFGRFDPITQDWIDQCKLEAGSVVHDGLTFRSRPLSPKN